MPMLATATAQRWDTAVKVWLAQLRRDDTGDEAVASLRGFLNALHEMLESLGKAVAPRDTWEATSSGLTVFLRSKKLSIDISLDLDDVRGRWWQ